MNESASSIPPKKSQISRPDLTQALTACGKSAGTFYEQDWLSCGVERLAKSAGLRFGIRTRTLNPSQLEGKLVKIGAAVDLNHAHNLLDGLTSYSWDYRKYTLTIETRPQGNYLIRRQPISYDPNK